MSSLIRADCRPAVQGVFALVLCLVAFPVEAAPHRVIDVPAPGAHQIEKAPGLVRVLPLGKSGVVAAERLSSDELLISAKAPGTAKLILEDASGLVALWLVRVGSAKADRSVPCEACSWEGEKLVCKQPPAACYPGLRRLLDSGALAAKDIRYELSAAFIQAVAAGVQAAIDATGHPEIKARFVGITLELKGRVRRGEDRARVIGAALDALVFRPDVKAEIEALLP